MQALSVTAYGGAARTLEERHGDAKRNGPGKHARMLLREVRNPVQIQANSRIRPNVAIAGTC